MSLLVLLVVSWCGAVSLQHISSEADNDFHNLERSLYLEHNPFVSNLYDDPYTNTNEAEFYKTDVSTDMTTDNKFSVNSDDINYVDFYKMDNMNPESSSKDLDSKRIRRWLPNLVDTDKTLYIKVDNNKKDNSSPFAIQALQEVAGTKHVSDISESNEEIILNSKRNFSPWGGKRSSQNKVSPDRDGYHYTWSWKRSPGQDSSMPKRVRFSPWGGKRSGNLIFKPSKTSKIIYTALVPELWFHRFNSIRSPKTVYNQFPFKGFTKKRFPFKMLKYKNNDYDFLKHNNFGNGFPFYDFLEPSGINIVESSPKKDGKRKVKFSAWGGKRTPPVIGPVWTPSMENVKDKGHRTIFMITDDSEKNLRPDM